jgi:hypothetical protein
MSDAQSAGERREGQSDADADRGADVLDTLDTFSLLAEETRLTILRELAAAGPAAEREPVSFAELRRRVGTADSGRFNYHLDKLQPQFVQHVDEDDGPSGYRPTWAGIRVIGAALAGQFDADSVAGEAESTCPECGAPATISHDDGVMAVDCDEHQLRIPVPAGAAEGRDLEELLEVGVALTERLVALARQGICPNCYGTLSVEPVTVGDGGPYDEADPGSVLFRDDCDRCRGTVAVPAGLFVGDHPAVVSFYHDHGVDLDLEALIGMDWTDPGTETVRERNPLELVLPIEHDGDRLELVVDDGGDVVDVSRP